MFFHQTKKIQRDVSASPALHDINFDNNWHFRTPKMREKIVEDEIPKMREEEIITKFHEKSLSLEATYEKLETKEDEELEREIRNYSEKHTTAKHNFNADMYTVSKSSSDLLMNIISSGKNILLNDRIPPEHKKDFEFLLQSTEDTRRKCMSIIENDKKQAFSDITIEEEEHTTTSPFFINVGKDREYMNSKTKKTHIDLILRKCFKDKKDTSPKSLASGITNFIKSNEGKQFRVGSVIDEAVISECLSMYLDDMSDEEAIENIGVQIPPFKKKKKNIFGIFSKCIGDIFKLLWKTFSRISESVFYFIDNKKISTREKKTMKSSVNYCLKTIKSLFFESIVHVVEEKKQHISSNIPSAKEYAKSIYKEYKENPEWQYQSNKKSSKLSKIWEELTTIGEGTIGPVVGEILSWVVVLICCLLGTNMYSSYKASSNTPAVVTQIIKSMDEMQQEQEEANNELLVKMRRTRETLTTELELELFVPSLAIVRQLFGYTSSEGLDALGNMQSVQDDYVPQILNEDVMINLIDSYSTRTRNLNLEAKKKIFDHILPKAVQMKRWSRGIITADTEKLIKNVNDKCMANCEKVYYSQKNAYEKSKNWTCEVNTTMNKCLDELKTQVGDRQQYIADVLLKREELMRRSAKILGGVKSYDQESISYFDNISERRKLVAHFFEITGIQSNEIVVPFVKGLFDSFGFFLVADIIQNSSSVTNVWNRVVQNNDINDNPTYSFIPEMIRNATNVISSTADMYDSYRAASSMIDLFYIISPFLELLSKSIQTLLSILVRSVCKAFTAVIYTLSDESHKNDTLKLMTTISRHVVALGDFFGKSFSFIVDMINGFIDLIKVGNRTLSFITNILQRIFCSITRYLFKKTGGVIGKYTIIILCFVILLLLLGSCWIYVPVLVAIVSFYLHKLMVQTLIKFSVYIIEAFVSHISCGICGITSHYANSDHKNEETPTHDSIIRKSPGNKISFDEDAAMEIDDTDDVHNIKEIQQSAYKECLSTYSDSYIHQWSNRVVGILLSSFVKSIVSSYLYPIPSNIIQIVVPSAFNKEAIPDIYKNTESFIMEMNKQFIKTFEYFMSSQK